MFLCYFTLEKERGERRGELELSFQFWVESEDTRVDLPSKKKIYQPGEKKIEKAKDSTYFDMVSWLGR
jgi:hypothetical protein